MELRICDLIVHKHARLDVFRWPFIFFVLSTVLFFFQDDMMIHWLGVFGI